MASSQAVEQQQFMELVSLHQSQVFGYIYALVRDLNETEDLYQQTCLIMWKKFADYDPAVKFSTWACGVAQFEVLNHLRKRGRRPLDFSDVFLQQVPANLEDDDPVQDRRGALSHCVGKLKDADRQLVELCYGDEMTAQQAGKQVGRSTQGVYNSLSRIRRLLYDCIQRRLAGGES